MKRSAMAPPPPIDSDDGRNGKGNDERHKYQKHHGASKESELFQVARANELRKLVDSANAPIFGIDLNGRVNEWNFKTAEITGYSREEAYDKPLVASFIAEHFRESVQEVLDKALQGDETANYELEFDTKSKETRVLLVNASTRRDVHNNIVGGKYLFHQNPNNLLSIVATTI
jgi:PAS domain S-box-containing protein